MNASNLPNIEIARFNMVEQQIRPWDVSDENVLKALSKIRRECFVPPAYRALAFSDIEVPLILQATDTHQFMLSPKMEARLAQLLALKADDCEIGRAHV